MSAPVSRGRRFLAWCVHVYTGSGLILAAWITQLLAEPNRTPETYRLCFLLMLVAVVIDATDGTFARWVRIKEAVPEFDGRRLDDLVDFLMYTCLPLLLIDRAGLLPAGWSWVLLVALGASAYGFSQTDVKTDDGAFMGFPSYWNVVAFYAYTLPIDGYPAVILILVLSALTFVPSYYPYPTQPGTVNRWMLVLSVPWTALLLYDVLQHWENGPTRWSVLASFAYPLLYLGVAWGTSLRRALAPARPSSR